MSGRAYVVVVIVTLAMVVGIVRQVRMRRLRAKYALLWLAVGAAITPIALIPDLLDRIATFLGVAYGPAVLLMFGLGFFALLSLHFSCELTRLEERTRVLAEETALLRGAVARTDRRSDPSNADGRSSPAPNDDA